MVTKVETSSVTAGELNANLQFLIGTTASLAYASEVRVRVYDQKKEEFYWVPVTGFQVSKSPSGETSTLVLNVAGWGQI